MSSKELTAFRIAPELMGAMRDVKNREGIAISRQVDFALREWLKRKGALKNPAKK